MNYKEGDNVVFSFEDGDIVVCKLIDELFIDGEGDEMFPIYVIRTDYDGISVGKTYNLKASLIDRYAELEELI